jgi:hypothetical protein
MTIKTLKVRILLNATHVREFALITQKRNDKPLEIQH